MGRCLLFVLLWMGASVAAMADSQSVVGTWTLEVDTPRGIQHPTLEILADGESYHGSYTGQRGELKIDQITIDGSTFSFPLRVTLPMGEMDFMYEGQVEGDAMTGEIGNPRGSIPFTGVRAD